MSKEYFFYPCIIIDGKASPLLRDIENDPAYMFYKSRSFIEGDFFTQEDRMLRPSEISEEFTNHFTEGEGFDKNEMTFIYFYTKETLLMNAGEGIVTGYVPIETLKEIDPEYMTDFLHFQKDSILSSEIAAEMDPDERKKYVKIYGIDYWGKEYICRYLLSMLNDIYVPSSEKGSVGYLVFLSF